jgi:hypothetical protein
VRTTVTLDEDTARQLREDMQRTGRTFKEAINEAIRVGLSARRQPEPVRFEISPKPLGIRPGMSYDNVAELLEQVEGPSAR